MGQFYLPREEPDQAPGGCGETLALTRIAFAVMAPILLLLAGGVLAVLSFITLFSAENWLERGLAAAFLAGYAVGLGYFIRVIEQGRRRDGA